MSKITDNKLTLTKDIIANLQFKKYRRNIDRKKLQIKMNMSDSDEDDNTAYYSDDNSIIDGVKVSSIKKWLNKDTIIGKMIRYLYSQTEEVSFEELKIGINYTKSDKEFDNNINCGIGHRCRYGKLWTYKNNEILLNIKIRSYIEKL